MFRIDRAKVNMSAPQAPQAEPKRAPAAEPSDAASPVQPEAPAAEVQLPVEFLEQAQAQADELIASAIAEAENIQNAAQEMLQNAEAEATEIFENARKLGYEEGMAQLESASAEVTQSGSDALERLLAEVEAGRTQMLSELEPEIIDLCFAVIRKIAALDRSRDGELFRATIKKALSELEPTSKFTIRLCNEDAERFFPSGNAEFKIGDSIVSAEISKTDSFTDGDIVVESDNVSMNAGVESQISSIELAFKRLAGASDE